MKGLNFSLPPKNIDYDECSFNFELLNRNTYNLSIFSNAYVDFEKEKK